MEKLTIFKQEDQLLELIEGERSQEVFVPFEKEASTKPYKDGFNTKDAGRRTMEDIYAYVCKVSREGITVDIDAECAEPGEYEIQVFATAFPDDYAIIKVVVKEKLEREHPCPDELYDEQRLITR